MTGGNEKGEARRKKSRCDGYITSMDELRRTDGGRGERNVSARTGDRTLPLLTLLALLTELALHAVFTVTLLTYLLSLPYPT